MAEAALGSAYSDDPSHGAEVVYPGDAAGRPAIELRINPDGTNEAFLAPSGGGPVPTGVSLYERDGNYFIRCRIRKKLYKFKAEEVVHQKVINWLIDDLGYSSEQLAVEVPVTIGSTVHDKSADVIVYTDTSRTQQWIIVEVKKPRRKDGIEQLKSYMNATGATFGYWSNGADEKFLLRTKANDFSNPIWRLPASNEDLADIDEPLTRAKLKPVADLYGVFKDIEQEILAHQSVDTFNEIFKVVFAKLYDERVNLYNDSAPARFRRGVTEAVQPAASSSARFV